MSYRFLFEDPRSSEEMPGMESLPDEMLDSPEDSLSPRDLLRLLWGKPEIYVPLPDDLPF